MSRTHGFVDHGSDDGLPVHRGPAAKAGGTLAGASTRSRCRARKLAVTTAK
jgi:hypothetical protein